MNKEQIIPLGKYVLVKRKEEESGSSIIYTNTTTQNRGNVLAVGDEVNTDNESQKLVVGDEIIYIPGNEVAINNSEKSDFLISVGNIIGKVKVG